jgi:hypothetical protein
MIAAARKWNLGILGGDTAEGDTLELHITGVGRIPRNTAVLRSGARTGDLVYVTGALGGAYLPGSRHHLLFEPRLEAGRFLGPEIRHRDDGSLRRPRRRPPAPPRRLQTRRRASTPPPSPSPAPRANPAPPPPRPRRRRRFRTPLHRRPRKTAPASKPRGNGNSRSSPPPASAPSSPPRQRICSFFRWLLRPSTPAATNTFFRSQLPRETPLSPISRFSRPQTAGCLSLLFNSSIINS